MLYIISYYNTLSTASLLPRDWFRTGYDESYTL